MTPTEDDLRLAKEAILEAKRLASRAKSRIDGRLDPQGLEWPEALALANATKDLVFHAGWILAHLRQQVRS